MTNTSSRGTVVAVSISSGGIPKIPQTVAQVGKLGLQGDGRGHAKHNKPSRAVSLWDEEVMDQLRIEGYSLEPGAVGENILLRGVDIQAMQPETLLQIGEVRILLEEPRKPCYILDPIDPKLKDDIVGRCGYLASVVQEGQISPGDPVRVIESASDGE